MTLFLVGILAVIFLEILGLLGAVVLGFWLGKGIDPVKGFLDRRKAAVLYPKLPKTEEDTDDMLGV